MSKISVFGSGGFIGSHYLNKYKFESIPVRRNIIQAPTNEILTFISTVDNYNIFSDPLLDIYTNNILLMKMLQMNKLVYGKDFTVNYISSWFTYGNHGNDIVSEESYCDPKGLYAISKRTAEQLLISYCETFGIKYRIFRLANVLGVGDKKASKKKNAIQFMIEELATGNTIQLYKEPSYRNIIDVRDCVEIIHNLIKESPTNEIYNVGTTYSRNVNDIIEFAHGMCGTGKIEMVDVPEFHKQVQGREFHMNTGKIANYLPQNGFHSLPETLEWIISEKRKLNENS